MTTQVSVAVEIDGKVTALSTQQPYGRRFP